MDLLIFHASIHSSDGGIIVSCQDLSTNGIKLNGMKISKASVILMDGDIFEIPGSQCDYLWNYYPLRCPVLWHVGPTSAFKCVHILKQRPEKNNIFDPTPSSQVSYKVRTHRCFHLLEQTLNREYFQRMGNYTLTSHCLGSGSFATVHLAVDTFQHRQVACKVIKTRKRDEMKKICAEATILMGLDHPNINKFYGFEEQDRTLFVSSYLVLRG